MTTLTISDTADYDNNDLYFFIEELSEGFFKARSQEGEFVLLKKIPFNSLNSWQRDYIRYRSEIISRVKENRVEYCELSIYLDLLWIKQIEGGQVVRRWVNASGVPLLLYVFPANSRIEVFNFFELNFIESNTDMAKELEKGHEISFADRVFMAQLMMNAIAALHEAGIVHTDLKPDNILLIPNEDERTKQFAKYHAKLIDMDCALLADKKAPWDGHEGYTGTPGYFSPEHLTGIPEKASDVFTCGLILCELLCDKHPLLDLADDQEAYLGKINAREVSCPPLLGKMEELETPGNTQMVEDIIYQCLNPDPGKRPTASAVNAALNYEGGPPPPPPPPIKGDLLLINKASGEQLTFGVETKVGKHLLEPLGEDSKFFHKEQFILNKDSEGCWQVVPDENAPNETLLNGKKITEPVRLGLDDQLAVGREERGIVKLPLTCREG